VSARISKRQEYQDFLRKREGAVLAKKGNLRRTRKNLKNLQISLLLGSIKCFAISFNTLNTLGGSLITITI
jgi:hypothetical protein